MKISWVLVTICLVVLCLPVDALLAADPISYPLPEAHLAYRWIRTIGRRGRGNGEFISPAGIAFGPSGNIFVADRGNHRIQEFDREGHYLRQFGNTDFRQFDKKGNGVPGLSYPTGIALDPSGNLWVADGPRSRIVKFDSKDRYVTHIGCPIKYADSSTADHSATLAHWQ